jgi:hypothetical protein
MKGIIMKAHNEIGCGLHSRFAQPLTEKVATMNAERVNFMITSVEEYHFE